MMKKLIALTLATMAVLFVSTFATAETGYYTSKQVKATTMNPPLTDITIWNSSPYLINVTYPVYMNVMPHGGEHIYNDRWIDYTHIEMTDRFNNTIFSGEAHNHSTLNVRIENGEYVVDLDGVNVTKK